MNKDERHTRRLDGEALVIAGKIQDHREDMRHSEERINSLFTTLFEQMGLPQEERYRWGLDAQALRTTGEAFLLKLDSEGIIIARRTPQ